MNKIVHLCDILHNIIHSLTNKLNLLPILHVRRSNGAGWRHQRTHNILHTFFDNLDSRDRVMSQSVGLGRPTGVAWILLKANTGGGESELENRLLLVEDEAPLRRSLEKFLERAGYAFDSCATAREALTLAQKRDYSIALVEYHLPDANGASLLEKLQLAIPGIMAIMISEYDFQAVASDLVHSNVRCYLKKPFDLAEFEAALENGSRLEKADWVQESVLEGMPASVLK